MDVVQKINQMGQSIWYDNIERKLLDEGTLERMIAKGEIRGITSNPSIFNKAISQSSSYDDEINLLTSKGLSREEVYDLLAVQDIQRAADLFRPLYKETRGGDGYVSLEVSPYLANDTGQTISEAKRLWKKVDRPNLMVKIPATLAGLPAVTEVIAEGINVNVTLIFSLERYREVREAYLAGLEQRAAAGNKLSGIASVASFFISRIDTKVDQELESIANMSSSESREKFLKIAGKAAIASGKLAYQDYQETFGKKGNRFAPLQALGASPQRALWASTSTKNPAYPDTMYVDDLIGPQTVNTIPPKTLAAFLEHGKVERTIDQDLDAARQVFASLSGLGIDMDKITQELELEGVQAFADAFTSLLESLEKRMGSFQQA